MSTLSEIVRNFGLTRKGKEYRGDCPICQARKLELSVWEDAGKIRCKCFYGACDSRELFRLLVGKQPTPSGGFRISKPQSRVSPATLVELWTKSRTPQGSPVSNYLRFRGYQGTIPESIRYLPNHKHTQSGQTFPVMLARVSNRNGSLQALHRTFLQSDGQGKAQVEPNKKSLGLLVGAAIPLAEASEQVILCEGIETGLALLQETAMPVWACISAGGLGTVNLPVGIRSVIIAADHDPVGIRAAEKAARLLYYEGRAVKVIKPKQPGTDFADQILKLGKEL